MRANLIMIALFIAAVSSQNCTSGPANDEPAPGLFQEGHVAKNMGAAALYFVLSGLAMSAGIGGGGLFVPLLIVINSFSKHTATALSQSMLFCVVLSGFVLNVRQKQPGSEKPLIDLKIVLMLAPANMAGALVGVMINQSLPPQVLVGLIFVVFSWSAYKTLQKGMEVYKKEKEERRQLLEQTPRRSVSPNRDTIHEEEGAASMRVKFSPKPGIQDGYGAVEVTDVSVVSSEQKEAFEARENRFDPLDWFMLFCMEIFVFIIIFVKGGKSTPSLMQLDKCTRLWWAAQGGALVLLFFLCTWLGSNTIGFYTRKTALGISLSKGEVLWNKRMTIRFVFFFFFASVVAAIIGIGGGVILIPMLLSTGLQPQCAAAISSTLVIVTSSTAATAFIVAGQAPIHFCAFYGAVCFCGGFVGKYYCDRLVKKYKVASLVVFILFGLMSCILCLVLYIGISDIVKNPTWEGFTFPCTGCDK